MSGKNPVTHAECKANVNLVLEKIDNVHKDINDIDLILRGAQGRNGLVRDVNYLMNQSKTLIFVISTFIGLVAGIIGTVVTHYLIG